MLPIVERTLAPGVVPRAVQTKKFKTSMLGITFPWPDTVSYFLFYGIYLVVELVILYFFLNSVSVTYALAYQSLCPEKEADSGVVLGNIFQM